MKLVTPLVLVLVSLTLVACYGAAPPRPARVPLPPLADGAQIDVFSQTQTTMESVQKTASACPQGHADGDPACVVTHYSVVEPVTRTKSTASYGADPITFAQFKVLTDPQYDRKLVELEALSHACSRANHARYAGMGMLIAGVVLYAVSGDKGALGWAAWGSEAGGAAAYAAGYYALGGRKCNEAEALYHTLDMSAVMTKETVEGSDQAGEMKTLAEQFNASTHPRSASLQMRTSR